MNSVFTLVTGGRSSSSITRRSKQGYYFSVAGLFGEFSKWLSVYVSGLAK